MGRLRVPFLPLPLLPPPGGGAKTPGSPTAVGGIRPMLRPAEAEALCIGAGVRLRDGLCGARGREGNGL